MKTFIEAFEEGLENGTIEESVDGEVMFNSDEPRMGWFVTPKKRLELEELLKAQ